MSKRNRSLLRRELDELPMEEMVMEAVAGTGQTHRCGRIFADTLDIIVIIAVGDAAQGWMEMSDSYTRMVQLSQEGGPTDGQETP